MITRVNVDQRQFEYVRFLSVEPRLAYDDAGHRTEFQQTDRATGFPCWTLTVIAKQKDQKAETINIKVVSEAEPPVLNEFDLIAFADLVAAPYVSGNRANLSFSTSRYGKRKE